LLVRSILGRSGELSGIQLLASAIAVWITNLLTFSIHYWQLDRGGPEARVRRTGVRPDWLFPQDGAPELAPGWLPGFVDYLALGFNTATAFSPTDTLPLTTRAKLLMMFESTVSLVTVLIVAARAINVPGVRARSGGDQDLAGSRRPTSKSLSSSRSRGVRSVGTVIMISAR